MRGDVKIQLFYILIFIKNTNLQWIFLLSCFLYPNLNFMGRVAPCSVAVFLQQGPGGRCIAAFAEGDIAVKRPITPREQAGRFL